MERTITIAELQNTGVNTWSVKDDSPRGIHTAYTSELKPGDKVVIDNYFTTVTEAPAAVEEVTEEAAPVVAEFPKMKKVRMNYSLYKSCYSQFAADNYDAHDKAVMVEVPDTRRPSWPKDWARNGNHLTTPGGCKVTFWGSGCAENYLVERYISRFYQPSRTISAGIDSRERVMEAVAEFEAVNHLIGRELLGNL